MKIKKLAVLLFLGFSILLKNPAVSALLYANTQLCIVSYNAQTFFDAVNDGNEFNSFRKKDSGWTAEKYRGRLAKLHEVLNISCKQLKSGKKTPDILFLQEIESVRVIEDFCKRLPKNESYPYAVFFPPESGGAFSTAILSKYPVKEFRSHKLHSVSKRLRPLVEAVIIVGKHEITVFNVHWKSKTGDGGYDTRKKQEELLFSKLSELKKNNMDTAFIACGDFNQTLEEFYLMNSIKNCWNSMEYLKRLKKGEQPEGSYFFQKKWEKIDHIFYSDSFNGDKHSIGYVKLFAVINAPELTKRNGTPKKYTISSNKGYSDHLPLGLIIELKDL